MSIIRTVTVTVSLLSIVMTQVLSLEDLYSVGGREESKLLAALNGVSHALGCFGDILSSQAEKSNNALESFGDLLRDSVRLHNQETDTLAEVERLRKRVDELTRENSEQITQLADKDQKVDELTRESNDQKIQLAVTDQKVGELTRENSDQKMQLAVKDQKVDELTRENSYQKMQIAVKDQKVDDLTRENNDQKMQLAVKDQKVQDLEKRLNESERLAENLAKQVKRLNSTTASESSSAEELFNCGPQQENVKKEVKKYVKDQDWEALRTGLATVLEHDSPAAMQLQNITDYYASPLYEVVVRDYQDLVKLLLCHGLPVNTAGWNKLAMLHAAVRRGNVQMVKLLLHHGAEANSLNIFRRPLLVVAAQEGYLDIVQVLVSAGADTSLTDKDGHRAQDIARYYGHTAVAQYLAQISQ